MRRIIAGCAAFICLAGCSGEENPGGDIAVNLPMDDLLPVENIETGGQDLLANEVVTEGVGVNDVGE